MRRWLSILAVVALATVAAGCGSIGEDTTGTGSTKVVAAFYPVAAAAQAVGGRCVTVTNLTPAGAEPHDLELIPDQVDKIQDADVVFVMGHGFQPAVEKAADQRDGTTVKVLDHVGIDSEGRAVAEEGHEGDADSSEDLRSATAGPGSPPALRRPDKVLDPHVWLDPDLYAEVVDAMTAALVKADPKCATTVERNATRYKAAIATVGDDYAAGLADCKRHTIVTAHKALGYLAKRYGLTQQGIAGISPDEEPNAQRIAHLSDLVKQQGITTIFTEELVSPKVADALAREAGGVKTETLNPLEGLTDDELARGDDWASVMRTNLRKIEAALGCRAP